jgi:hypothetical protein
VPEEFGGVVEFAGGNSTWLICGMLVIDQFTMKIAAVLMTSITCLLGDEPPPEPGPPTPFEKAMEQAKAAYAEEEDQLATRYRARLADILDLADAVEIYRLDFSMAGELGEGRENDFFPIKPYSEMAEILARKRLIGEELNACRKVTAELLKMPENWGGAFCHYPIHGVRFLKGKEIVFESSFCWKCGNYYVTFPNDVEGSASWCVIGSDGIQKFLEKQLTIPQSELDRFEKDQGGGKPADVEKK